MYKYLLVPLFMLAPLGFAHAQMITFTPNSHGNWSYTTGIPPYDAYTTYIRFDGSGSSSFGSSLIDTAVPTAEKVEAFTANTFGAAFADSCSTPHFTGNPTVDLSCYALAAQTQNFPYAIGQSWQDAPAPDPTPDPAPTQTSQTSASPCKCP